MPDCSVIVCTRSRPAELGRCLETLCALEHGSFEIVVVDNSEGNEETRRTAEVAGARYVVEPRPGLSAARNRGVAEATGKIVAFIDDDAVADPGWLREHHGALDDSRAAASTGRILPITPTAARTAVTQMLDLGDEPFTVDPSTSDWFERANFGGLGFGGNMALRRALFDQGFGFYERLGRGAGIGGGEESHAFFSLIRSGASVRYVPDAIVRHDPPAEPREYEEAGLRRYSAYLSMLLVEHPEFRRRTIRYIWDAVRRRPQPWRRIDASARSLSRIETLAAAAGGPLLYVRSRRAR